MRIMVNYGELTNFFRDKTEVKIIILDNNNIQFCNHYEQYFSLEDSYNNYDIILVPGCVFAEVAHSKQRLNYLARLPKQLIIPIEEDDYLPLIGYEDAKLMKLFEYASTPYSSCRAFFKTLKQIIGKTGEIPDDWIADFYEKGFDVKLNVDGKQLKKNAGEISILVLSFLLIHHFTCKINQITISTSDMASYYIIIIFLII